MNVTIADQLFMPFGKSMHMLGDNIDVLPTHFEWQQEEPATARFVTELSMRDARGEGQIAVLLEPFFLHPQNYMWLMEHWRIFEHVLTHNAYFANQLGWLWHPFGGSMIRFEDWGVCEKKKNVSMLLSAKNYQVGHILRHEAVKRFSDRFDDIFGLVPWGRKIEALAPYRYAIIVETERSPYYFSEKLIDCLAVGTIPIYWGCPDIGRFFDRNGIIEFDDLDELDRILQWIDEDFYRDATVAIATNVSCARKYAICEDQIWDRYPFLFEGVS